MRGSTRYGRRYYIVKQAETNVTDFRTKAQALTTGFLGSRYKSFKDYDNAVAYMNTHSKVDFFVDPELPPI